MSGDLIGRLRDAAWRSYRQQAASTEVAETVVCPGVTALGDVWGHWCADVRDEHRCRWTCIGKNAGTAPNGRGTHPNYRHECGCGYRWGTGT